MYQRWISVGMPSDASADTCSTAKSDQKDLQEGPIVRGRKARCDFAYRKTRMKRSGLLLFFLLFLLGCRRSEGANNGSRKAGITIEHSANPAEAANCTPVTLTCRLVLDDQEAEVDVWWTFRGENATKLPNVTIDSDPSRRIWELHLLCPTVEHDGNYDCNAHSWTETELVYRKEATVKVYVPPSVEVGQNITAEEIGSVVNLTCLGYGFPQTSMKWYKNEQPLQPEDERLDVAVTSLNKETLYGVVMIYGLLREDNGTYNCKVENNHGMASASQDILVLEPPEVSVDSVDPLDSRTALLRWHVRYRGNLPVKRFHLQVKNFSIGADWLDVDDKIPPNATTYTVRYLAPAMTYGFQLAAVNDAGPSEWEIMNVTMPADVPPKVSWVHLLASTSETLLFGWRRPNHDNGAPITNYEVWLSKNGQLLNNGTMEVKQAGRTNYMYVFFSLEPGEAYSFQVQACSILGCGNWSDPLDAVTSDGFADPPENVEMTCINASNESPSYVIITWSFPKNSRGTLQGFNVSLDSEARYRNVNGNVVVEHFKEFIDVKGKTLTTKYIVKPNTRYTVRVCSVNKAGCGFQSMVTNKTTCASAPSVPESVPQFQLERLNKEKNCRQLKVKLSRVSERNGFIWCYRVIIVKLRKGDTRDTLSDLPLDPQNMNLSTYAEVHKSDKSSAYVAEAFSSENFAKEVVVGDNKFSRCHIVEAENTTESSGKQKRSPPTNDVIDDSEYVYDGELSHNTNYTGYLEVRVWGSNGTLLSKQSPYFSPVQTGSLPSSVPAESPVAFVFGIVCGVLLVVLVLVLVLCLVRRKNGHPYEEGERLGLTALIRRTVHRNGHLPRGKGNHLSKLPRLGPVSADELPAAFIERHIDSDLVFQSEFEALPEKHKDRTTNASDSPENLLKNRYPDIKAYDQTRVRLPLIEGVPGSDYINANFVEGYKGRKTFICAQGPLERTVFDFWRMIWEHRVCVIVMLTGIEEHGKIKCSQYWSDDEPKIIEETFSVSVVSTKKYSDYIVRRLQVKCIKDEDSKDEREILHFHFMMWKDFLAPEQPSWLLRFVKHVNENYSADRGPLLVHCSAGVGRTGTFVAIDSLLQQLEEEGQKSPVADYTENYHERWLPTTHHHSHLHIQKSPTKEVKVHSSNVHTVQKPLRTKGNGDSTDTFSSDIHVCTLSPTDVQASPTGLVVSHSRSDSNSSLSSTSTECSTNLQMLNSPTSKVKLSVLKEEKRLLMLQLKNKELSSKQKALDAGENNVDGEADSQVFLKSFTLPRFRKRTFSGTSLEKRSIPLYSSAERLSSEFDIFEKSNAVGSKTFNSLQQSSKPNETTNSLKKLKNIGTNCTVLTRDIGVGHVAERLRSVGIGDEPVLVHSKKCSKCGGPYVKSNIHFDSLSSSEFAEDEMEEEKKKVTNRPDVLKHEKHIQKTVEVADKATHCGPGFLSKPMLTCNKREVISIPPAIIRCPKCEERSLKQLKNTASQSKLINCTSLGVNTDRTALKNSGTSTDLQTKSISFGTNTDSIASNDSSLITELSMKDIEDLQLHQVKQKLTKDKGTGIPRPLLGNAKTQTVIDTKDSSTSVDIARHNVSIQASLPFSSENKNKEKIYTQVKKLCAKGVQTDNGSDTIDTYCGDCSIHDTFCDKCELRQTETIGVGNIDINSVLCDRCQHVTYADVAVGSDKPPMLHSVGVNTTERLMSEAAPAASGVHICDKCNAKIKSVAKNLVDKNTDNVFHPAFAQNLKTSIMEKSETSSVVKVKVETSESEHKSEESKNVIQEKRLSRKETLTKLVVSKRTSEHTGSGGEATDSSDSPSADSPDEKLYDGILSRIINRHKNNAPLNLESSEQISRKKAELSEEMKKACKILNESLTSKNVSEKELASGMEVIQKEWFHVSSKKHSDPHVVEDYLDAFEEISKHLLHTVVNLKDANGNTAMHYSVSHGNFDVVSVLLDSKVCDANIQNNAGYTAVMLISLAEIKNEAHKHVVQRLFQFNEINLKAAQNGQTALMLAASQGRTEAVKLLLECGAEINMQDKDGSTALMCAAEHGHADVVHILLAHPDCDATLVDNDGSSALSIAMEVGHRDVALMIYAKVNFSRGNSPYSSLRSRRTKTTSSSRSSLPPQGTPATPPRTPPPASSRPRKNSSSF